ncbi:MAG TPA: 23S rRNA (adenine(2030)-N(6))-methyltransferase RlmJ, partial [Rhodospirillaceae bacterium]|nr:23S rRNA (adenine(2030)-N(6))-methyltransferase RlmJ [Rhodospirillaceae bacterium]
LRHYPGSPLLAARMLRPQDRMIANELHPEDMLALKQNMAGFANVRVTEMDAFEVIRANIPPQERRGIVLIDPPYEIENNEHEIVAAQMQQWKKRWANGIYVLWYPIKGSLPVRDTLVEAATALGLPRTWLCEYRGANLPPLPGSDRGDRARMNAAGLIVFNAPYQVPERVEAALMEFAPVLGGGAETRWLVPDKSYQQG